MTTANWRKSS